MKTFLGVVLLLLMAVGASTVIGWGYGLVVRCKRALEVAERLDRMNADSMLFRLAAYVDEERQQKYYKSKLDKVEMMMREEDEVND